MQLVSNREAKVWGPTKQRRRAIAEGLLVKAGSYRRRYAYAKKRRGVHYDPEMFSPAYYRRQWMACMFNVKQLLRED